jgi:CBS domain-containing protein
MKAGEFCNREAIVCDKGATILEAARLMRRQHIGDVIMTETRDGQRVAVGISTDRDIVVELLAEQVDLDAVTVGDVMSFELLAVNEDDDLFSAIKLMRNRGIRRLPVVNRQGGLAGILVVDDLIELLTEQLNDLVQLMTNQRTREAERRV